MGKEFEKEITTAIEQCDTLLAIITPDSKKAPWLLYEAGYAKGNGKSTMPVLFYEDEKWTSWVDNPLNTSQHIWFINYLQHHNKSALEGNQFPVVRIHNDIHLCFFL